MTSLRGITWDHPRGKDSIVAASRAYSEQVGVDVTWEARSLQAFADQDLEALVAGYDLLVIDHPHIPHAAQAGLLAALPPDPGGAGAFIGRSYESYGWRGAQYGLAIDAAAQVSVHRPDLLAEPPTTWPQVLDLAREGVVLWPAKPIDAFSSAFSITSALQGSDAGQGGFGSSAAFAEAWHLLGELRDLVPAACLSQNPIEVADTLAAGDRWCYVPLAFGYTNYARAGFREHRLRYVDVPAVDGAPRGSMLGGAGLAVSAQTPHRAEAIAFATWVASGEVQAGSYALGGGQPGHVDAWRDPALDALTGEFFSGTRRTLAMASLRPRDPGYMTVQDAACDRIHRGLLSRERAADVLADLDTMFSTLGVLHADR